MNPYHALRPLPGLLLPLLFVGPSPGQWQSMNAGVQVSSATTHNGAIFVCATSYGVQRSTNDGASWSTVNSGLPNTSGAYLVEGIGSNGQVLFAGTQSGIYRSTNGGDSWTIANGTLTANVNVHAFKFFHFGNTTFAVFRGLISAGGGIQRTTNNGDSWLIGHSGMSSNMRVHHLAHTGSVLYAATSTGLYRSFDLGQQWSQVPGVNYEVHAVQYSAGRLHIISVNGYKYSTNDGGTWSNSTGTPAAATITKGELVSYNGYVYAATGSSEGVLITQNNGVSYTAFNTGLDGLNQATTQQFHASADRLYLGTLFNLWSIPGSTVGVPAPMIGFRPPYPTVFEDIFHLDVNEHHVGSTVVLYDTMGREVLRSHGLAEGRNSVERGDLAPGRYSCILFDPTGGRHVLGTVIAQ